MKLSVRGSLISFDDAEYWTNSGWADITNSVGATLNVTVTNIDGTSVANAASLPLSLVSGTSNNWALVLPNTVALVDGNQYWVELDITVGSTTVPFKQKFTAGYPDGGSTPN